jgi:nitroreductase
MRDANPVLELIHARLSTERFDPGLTLSEDEIRELIEDAIQAPSSFNIQHWRFVALRDPEDKKRLREAAYGQAVVEDAAVTFLVLGDVRGHEKLAAILEGSVEAGVISRRTADRWVEMSDKIYADEPLARDEAIRSATLAAMTLMLAAAARGLASAPLIGFDPERVRQDFGIPEHCLPVMLLCVGRAAEGNPPRKVRMGADRVLAFDRGRDF